MSQGIVLKSPLLRIDRIKKPTKAKFWKDRKVGDYVVLSMPVSRIEREESLYATYITVTCGDAESTVSLTNMANRLESFEFTAIKM